MNNLIEPEIIPDMLGVGILEENNADAFQPDEEDPEENEDDDNWGEDEDE